MAGLDKEQKTGVFRKAIDLASQSGSLRDTIVGALKASGHSDAVLGGELERDLTLEVGRALNLRESTVRAVESWDQGNESYHEVVAAFQQTIEHLAR